MASTVVQDKGTRYLITAAVMCAAIMQILDTTIVTVALPHMQGQLGTNATEISWVLTSYLISAGIFMPLTGFMTDRFGQRTYLVWSIIGFTIASMLCGLAANLDQIVLFRLAQGVAGAGLLPTAQAILINLYPREERGKAMAIFGVGAMVGPIMGPTLGGYLTQILSWRWTFFINLPVGVLALIGVWALVPETEKKERRADWIGFAFLVVAISAMQFVFDRGQQMGWFSSHTIQIAAGLSVFGFICLILRNLEMGKDAIFDLRIFKDRNFAGAALLLSTFMFCMYGMLALQPQMLETIFGYPTFTTGLVQAPRGAGSMLAMFLAGHLINRTGARPLMLAGIIITVSSSYVMTQYSLQTNEWWFIWPVIVQGFGLGMFFVPLATATFATLSDEQTAEAAGIRQIARSIASGLGIAMASTVVADQTQTAWNQMGGHLTSMSDALAQRLNELHLSAQSPLTGPVLTKLLGQQAHFQGMMDAFLLLTAAAGAGLPILLLLKKGVGRESGDQTPGFGEI